MERIVKHCGRFTLFQGEQGFACTMTGEGGRRWYWHPGTQEWAGYPHASHTAEEATAGLVLDSQDTVERPPVARRAPLCRPELMRRR